MKFRYVFLAICVMVALSVTMNSLIYAGLPQLGHQNYGAPAERVAVRIGPTVDTVFVGAGLNVRVFAVNHVSPGTPSELSLVSFDLPGTCGGLAVHPSKSIIVAATSKGFFIRDYKNNLNLSVPPTMVGWGMSDVIFSANGNTAFTTGGSYFHVVDMTNPASATEITAYETGSFLSALAFKGSGGADTLFTVGMGFKALKLYNVTTPASPSLIVTSLSGDSVMNMNKRFADVAVIKDTIYVVQQDSGIRAFPRSNINSPGTLTPINNNNIEFLAPAKSDSFLIISSKGGGDYGLKVRNIYTGQTATYNSMGAPFQTIGGFGNLVYVAFYGSGFQIFDISNPLSPVPLGSGIGTGDNVCDVTSDDRNIGYIAACRVGVKIVNLNTHSDIGTPLIYQSGDTYIRVLVRNNILYACTDATVKVVNVTNPATPVLLGSYTGALSNIQDAALPSLDSTAVPDTLLAIADGNGISLLNIKNPQSIGLYGSIPISGGCNSIDIRGKTLLASPQNRSFTAYDLTSLAAPTLSDSTMTPAIVQQGMRFVRQGRYVYYATYDSVLRFDVSNPFNLINLGSIVGRSDHMGLSGSLAVAGKYLHVGFSDGSVAVFDTTTKAIVDTFNNIGYSPFHLKINGLNLFVAAQADGYYHLSDKYGAARVRIPTMAGMPQDTVEARVKLLDNLMSLPSMSFEMFFNFDTNYVQYVSMQRGSILPSGDSLASILTHSGIAYHTDTLKIVMADTGNIGLGTDSTLLKIKFRIRNAAPVEPLIQYATVKAVHMLFAEGTPFTDFRPGRINVVPRFGDANTNGSVTAADASYILQSVLGIVAQPSLVLADVSNNGEVRAYDAALILKRLVNPAFKYPVETYYGLKQASAPINKDIKIMITTENSISESEKTADIANSIVYGISMKNVREVLSAEMVIDLGKGQKYVGYKLSPLSEGMTVQSKQEGTILYVSMAGGEAITKDGMLLELICQITDAEQMKPLDIQQFILNESLIENIEGALSGTPKTYALSQNYPNPFNPVTAINYQLPNPGKITLTIYNILGQQVKMLVNSSQPAGYYTIRWNGRDNAGINVASGVYFYRIQAGGFVKTKKMLLIK